MKFKILIVLLIFRFSHEAFSQTDTLQMVHNFTYIEIGGIGGYGSLNYERLIFNKKNIAFAIRLGLSTYHIKDYTNKFNPDIIIPISLNGYYGNNHKIEMGIGQTIGSMVRAGDSGFETERNTNVHTSFLIGYRYQKKNSGIIFRCTYNPILEFNKHFRHWAGISVGYSF